jgi:hypothetical protein
LPAPQSAPTRIAHPIARRVIRRITLRIVRQVIPAIPAIRMEEDKQKKIAHKFAHVRFFL